MTPHVSSSQGPLPNPLQAWLSGWISNHRHGQKPVVTLLAGDGSDRKFYRVQLRSESLVLLSDPSWTSSKDYPAHQAYLGSRGISVPRFLADDPGVGALLMEDLGDVYLQTQIESHPDKKRSFFGMAAQTLADLHGKTFPVPTSVPCFQRSFDKEKLLQELQYTFTHLAEGYLGLQMSSKENQAAEHLATTVSKIQPLVFCHRDYHTRNILWFKSGLYLIDFQDARMGPPQYDLASLIYDAYSVLEDSERNELVEVYRTALRSYPVSEKIDWDSFVEGLHWTALQRVLKAAGSFASFYTRSKKTTHLKYIRPALESAAKLQLQLGRGTNAWPIRIWMERLAQKPLPGDT